MASMMLWNSYALAIFHVVYMYFNVRNCWAFETTNIITTVPVNPVPIGGMLAFHCRIFNLQRDHTVAISKTHGSKLLQISHADLLEDDTRYFLAVRQLSDTSIVYFLSIIDVTYSDAGQYSCKVLDMSALSEVASDKVDVHVSYLPPDNYPVCTSSSLTVTAGSSITYNCSSELGFPNVSIGWSRTGDGSIPKSRDYYSESYVTSVLTLQPSVEDSGTVFICTLTNKVISETRTCHFGPISVKQNPDDVTGIRHPPMITTGIESQPNFPVKTKSSEKQCRNLCKEQEGTLFTWMISTAIAACIAILLLIVGVMLCIKLKYNRDTDPPPRYIREDIYAELDKRFEEESVYMALDRSESEKVYNAYNQTLPRRSDNIGYGNVASVPVANTSL